MRLATALLIAATVPCALLGQSTSSTRRPTTRPAPAPAPATDPTPAPAAKPAAKPAATTQRAALAKAASTESNTSIGLRIGTLGLGAELSHLLNDHIGVRASAHYLRLNHNLEDISDFTQLSGATTVFVPSRVQWVGKLNTTSFSGMLDWYPGRRGVFRFSVGAMSAPAKATAVERQPASAESGDWRPSVGGRIRQRPAICRIRIWHTGVVAPRCRLYL
jgi:hypothetical protein